MILNMTPTQPQKNMISKTLLIGGLLLIILIIILIRKIPEQKISDPISQQKTILTPKRTFTFKDPTVSNSIDYTYDFSSVKCDPTASSEIKIIYHNKERKRLLISFDCYHGATGNTSDAFYEINLVDYSTQLISTDYVLYPIEDNYRISPNNKYLILSNSGNGGGCVIYSSLGLVNLDTLKVVNLDPPSENYGYLKEDPNLIEVSIIDRIDDKSLKIWDENNNLLFFREIDGCSNETTEFNGGFYTIFTEKWSYSPDKNTYTLIEKIKN